jgi:cell division protein FtsI (penicillin-binding protein 3)
MRELAMTVQVDSIYAVPNEIDDKDKAAARTLAAIVHTDPADAQTTEHEIEKRLTAAATLPGSRAVSRPKIAARVRAST